MHGNFAIRKNVAVIGTGIAGMSAAWLLSQKHNVTVYESDRRVGGHSNTVDVPTAKGPVAVDTGFIVYNEETYPNLTALFDYLEVRTEPSKMSFAVSLADGDLEYSGDLGGLFADKRNMLRLRFWSMLFDLQRFYREAPRDLAMLEEFHTTLGDYLDAGAYGAAFRDDHLLPMAASIWSAPASTILDYPAAAFIRFQDSHGLLRLRNRPQWRTVAGGSRTYVEKLTRSYADCIRRSATVLSVQRSRAGVEVRDCSGGSQRFDDVVIATHADQALALLDSPRPDERRILGCFSYSRNDAVLHSDPSLMPRRRAVWSSWNHIGGDSGQECGEDRGAGGQAGPTVSYWMNSLQNIPNDTPLFLTLNPPRQPRREWHREVYHHPLFDSAAIRAQRELWSLQGRDGVWYAGAYFGAGFHEDGLQAGLAVAEALGGLRRPWRVANESGRITVEPARPVTQELTA